jgi:DNA-binding transcriptional regulator YbjK
MANEHLATYLNDHLSGSVAAVELLEHLEKAYAETEMARFFAALRSDIEADRQELKALMDRLDVSESRPRKATAWLAGKFTELKMRLDDGARGPLRLLESLEAVALGVQGKLALWRALSAAAQVTPQLLKSDYDRLARRAEEQHSRLEGRRIEAAKTALSAM